VEETPEQLVDIQGESAFSSLKVLDSVDGPRLVINGDLLTTGSLYFGSGGFAGEFATTTLSSNQSYLLPDSSGEICLDSNNCNFASPEDVQTATAIQGGAGIVYTGRTIVNTGLLSLNSASGDVTIQGTTNQITVNRSGKSITFSLPQDLNLTSSPSFTGITVTDGTIGTLAITTGTQNGNLICDSSNNCGYAGGANAFIDGGNSFGAQAILGTNDTNSLSFETDGVTRLTIDAVGDATFTGSVAAADFSGDGSNLTNLNASNIASGTLDDARLTSNVAMRNAANTFTTGNQLIQTGAVGNVGLTVQGFAGQTANLQEWKDSTGTPLTSITANGAIGFGSASDLVLQRFAAATLRVSNAVNGANSTGGSMQIGGYYNSGASYRSGLVLSSGSVGDFGGSIQFLWQGSNSSTLSANADTTAALKLNTRLAVNTSYSTINANTRLTVNSPTAEDATVLFGSSAATSKGLVVRGAASQSANLQEWQDSTGAVLQYVAANGGTVYNRSTASTGTAMSIYDTGIGAYPVTLSTSAGSSGGLHSSLTLNGSGYSSNGGTLIVRSAGDSVFSFDAPNRVAVFNSAVQTRIEPVSSSATGLIIRGKASQTGNLQVWQNSSGTVLSSISASGVGAFANVLQNGNQVCDNTNNCSYAAASGSTNYIQNGTSIQSGANLAIQSASAGSIGAVVRGAASQTANLQEWQNSAGSVLTYIDASGFLNSPRFKENGNGVVIGGAASPQAGTNVLVESTGGSNKALVVKGYTGQTANLQEWQSSTGTSMSSVNASGAFFIGSASTSQGSAMLQVRNNTYGDIASFLGNSGTVKIIGGSKIELGSAVAYLDYGELALTNNSGNVVIRNSYNGPNSGVTIRANGTGVGTNADIVFQTQNGAVETMRIKGSGNVGIGEVSPSAKLQVTNTGAATVAAIIKGASAQSANLQEWQNSSGTVLSSINSSGSLVLGPTVNWQAVSVSSNNLILGAGSSIGETRLNASGSTYLRLEGSRAAVYIGTGVNGWSAPGTVERLRVSAAPTTVDNLANVIFATTATTSKGLVIQGLASQTANLQEWQSSTGTVLASVSATGAGSFVSLTQNGNNVCDISNNCSYAASSGSSSYIQNGTTIQTNANLAIQSAAAGSVGAVIRGAASQTANLQEWQYSSGAVLANVTQTGEFYSGLALSSNEGGRFQVQSNLGSGYLRILGSAWADNGNADRAVMLLSSTSRGLRLTAADAAGDMRFFTGGASAADEAMRITSARSVLINSTGTAGTVEKFRVNTPATVDNTAATILSTGATTSKGLVVQGAASQTANLQEWQSSTGTVLTSVSSGGNITVAATNGSVSVGTSQAGYIGLGTQANYSGTFSNTATMCINTVCLQGNGGGGLTVTNHLGGVSSGTISTNTFAGNNIASRSNSVVAIQIGEYVGNTKAHVGFNIASASTAAALFSTSGTGTTNLAVRAIASQTANLQEWQNSSGTVISSVTSAGSWNLGSTVNIGGATGTAGSLQFFNSGVTIARSANSGLTITTSGSGYGGGTTITNTSASGVKLTVTGAASQTANLQEWQDSSNTTLASLSASGDLNLLGGKALYSYGTGDPTTADARWGNFYNNGAATRFLTSGKGTYASNIPDMYFDKYNGTTLTNMMMLQSSTGNLGIGTTTIGTNNRLIVNPYSTVDNLATAQVNTNAATNKGLVVQGFASQSANLQEWQNSSGTALASVNASGQLTATGLVSTQSGSANDLYFNRSDTGAVRIKSNWGGATAYGVQIQPSAGSVTSYASGYGVLIGNAFSSSVTSGNYDILRVYDNAFNPTSGNSQLSGININPIINQTGTATGITRGLYVNPTLTSAVDFRGVEIANASGFGLYQSGASAKNYLAGNLGIGTTSAQAKLHISQTGISSSGQEVLRLSGEVIAATPGSGPKILFTAVDGTTPVASLQAYTFGASDVGLALGTGYNNVTNKLFINNAGNVGIGTSSPSSALEIVRGTGGAETKVLDLRSGTTTANTSTTLKFTNSDVTGSNIGSAITSVRTNAVSNGDSDLIFRTSEGFSLLQGMVLKSSGNVGIGETTPLAKLQVTNTTAATVATIIKGASAQSANLQEWQSSAGAVLSSINASGSFVNNGGAAGLSFGANNRTNLSAGGVVTFTSIRTSGDQYTAIGDTSQESMVLQSNGIFFANGGSTLMNILSATGNVGINNASAPNRLTVNTATTADSSAQLLLSTNGTTNKGLVVQGVASQTANLQEWQNSSGTVLGSVKSDGSLVVGSGNQYLGTASLTVRGTGAVQSAFIQNTASSSTGGSGIIGIQDDGAATSSGDRLGYILLGGAYDASNNAYHSAGITAFASQDFASGSGGSELRFEVMANNSSTRTLRVAIPQGLDGFTFGASQDTNLYRNGTGTLKTNGTLQVGGNISFDPTSASSFYGTSVGGVVQVTSATATAKGLVVKGAASQSANLQEWQNSSSTVLLSVGSTGVINSNATGTEHDLGVNLGIRVGTFIRFGGGSGGASSGVVRMFNNSAVNWRNAANTGNIGITVNASDTLQLGAAATTPDALSDTTIGTSATTRKGLVIQGLASQTANLQEWQSSTGTVLASISSAGNLTVVNATVNGTLVVNGASTFNGNITVNGQIITGNASGSTTVAVDTAGAGTGASASISGNDTSGVITINTGTGAAAGKLATITFSAAFPSSPNVVITPKAIPGGGAYPQYHYDSATGTFDLSSFNALTDSSTYTFSYFIVD
jgi:hypothetical protein